jgi:hypothetical protein
MNGERQLGWRRVGSYWKGIGIMKSKTTTSKRERRSAFIVAKASARTWVVAFSRRMIPGALFRSRDAALNYATMLARSAGLREPHVRVLEA